MLKINHCTIYDMQAKGFRVEYTLASEILSSASTISRQHKKALRVQSTCPYRQAKLVSPSRNWHRVL